MTDGVTKYAGFFLKDRILAVQNCSVLVNFSVLKRGQRQFREVIIVECLKPPGWKLTPRFLANILDKQ